MSPLRIILAEDDDDLRTLLAEELREDGHEVIDVDNGLALGHLIAAQVLHRGSGAVVVISDISLPGCSGLAVFRRHRASAGCPPFIFISGFGADDLCDEALRVGAFATLEKPFELEALKRTLAGIA